MINLISKPQRPLSKSHAYVPSAQSSLDPTIPLEQLLLPSPSLQYSTTCTVASNPQLHPITLHTCSASADSSLHTQLASQSPYFLHWPFSTQSNKSLTSWKLPESLSPQRPLQNYLLSPTLIFSQLILSIIIIMHTSAQPLLQILIILPNKIKIQTTTEQNNPSPRPTASIIP